MNFDAEKHLPLDAGTRENYVEYVLEIEEQSSYLYKCVVYQVESWTLEGEVYILDEVPLLRLVIKGDGCSHADFGDDGYVHLCGARDYAGLAQVLEELYLLAEDYFVAQQGRYPYWEKWDDV